MNILLYVANETCRGVIKLSILWWGDDTGSYGWTQCNHKGSYTKEAGEGESEGNVTRKQKTE